MSDRFTLAVWLNKRIGNVRVHHDTPEALKGELDYWLSVADDLLEHERGSSSND